MTLKLIQLQATEFGQVPKQLFFSPHPKKYSSHINEILANEATFDEIKKTSALLSLDSLNLESSYTYHNNHSNYDHTQSLFTCDYQFLPKFHKKYIVYIYYT